MPQRSVFYFRLEDVLDQKPFLIADLAEKLKEVLEGRPGEIEEKKPQLNSLRIERGKKDEGRQLSAISGEQVVF